MYHIHTGIHTYIHTFFSNMDIHVCDAYIVVHASHTYICSMVHSMYMFMQTLGLTKITHSRNKVSGVDEYTLHVGHPGILSLTQNADVLSHNYNNYSSPV